MYKEKREVSVVDAEIGFDGHLRIIMSNGVIVDAGSLNPNEMSQGEDYGYNQHELSNNSGVFVVKAEKSFDGHLLLILSNNNILDAGVIPVPEPIYKIIHKVGGSRGSGSGINLLDYWIVAQGTWDDSLQWVDSALWKDS